MWSETFELEDPLFASILVHELTHSLQLFHIGGKSHEAAAYQQESDFLRAAGVVGSVDQLDEKFTGPGSHEFFVEEAKWFRHYNVNNPAISP